MPKDEFDLDDPLELNGVVFLTAEDTSVEMVECFTEEFMRMGYNHKQVLGLFRNPHYTGPNMVFQNRGEPFIRGIISEVFARWGRPIQWPGAASATDPRGQAGASGETSPSSVATSDSGCSCGAGSGCGNRSIETEYTHGPDAPAMDPLGNPAPKLNL